MLPKAGPSDLVEFAATLPDGAEVTAPQPLFEPFHLKQAHQSVEDLGDSAYPELLEKLPEGGGT